MNAVYLNELKKSRQTQKPSYPQPIHNTVNSSMRTVPNAIQHQPTNNPQPYHTMNPNNNRESFKRNGDPLHVPQSKYSHYPFPRPPLDTMQLSHSPQPGVVQQPTYPPNALSTQQRPQQTPAVMYRQTNSTPPSGVRQQLPSPQTIHNPINIAVPSSSVHSHPTTQFMNQQRPQQSMPSTTYPTKQPSLPV